jgi:hypothetical protein
LGISLDLTPVTVRFLSCLIMLEQRSTHSGQINTLFGPSISVSDWLAGLPQKLHTALDVLLGDCLVIIIFLFYISNTVIVFCYYTRFCNEINILLCNDINYLFFLIFASSSICSTTGNSR